MEEGRSASRDKVAGVPRFLGAELSSPRSVGPARLLVK